MPPPVTCSAVEPTAAAIAELSTLFEQYRAHYGETPESSATAAWIAEMARSGELTFYGAHQGPRLAAFAAVHVVPASLRLRRFWQLRDLFVRPDARRLGVARRLIDVIRPTRSKRVRCGCPCKPSPGMRRHSRSIVGPGSRSTEKSRL